MQAEQCTRSLEVERLCSLRNQEASVRDFIADAFAHAKFIGYLESALPLLDGVGLPQDRDEGFIALDGTDGCAAFITACRQLRFWAREATSMHL